MKDEYKYQQFEDGNAVRELNYSALPQRENGFEELPRRDSDRISDTRRKAGNQTNPRTSPAREPQVVSLSAVAGFLLVAMLAVAVLTCNIRLNGLYTATVAQRHALVQLEEEYSKLKAADEEIFDNESLKKVADEAGLVKPGVNQQVYLKMSPPNNTVVYSNSESASGLAGVVQWVKGLLGLSA